MDMRWDVEDEGWLRLRDEPLNARPVYIAILVLLIDRAKFSGLELLVPRFTFSSSMAESNRYQ